FDRDQVRPFVGQAADGGGQLVVAIELVEAEVGHPVTLGTTCGRCRRFPRWSTWWWRRRHHGALRSTPLLWSGCRDAPRWPVSWSCCRDARLRWSTGWIGRRRARSGAPRWWEKPER